MNQFKTIINSTVYDRQFVLKIVQTANRLGKRFLTLFFRNKYPIFCKF